MARPSEAYPCQMLAYLTQDDKRKLGALVKSYKRKTDPKERRLVSATEVLRRLIRTEYDRIKE